MLNPPFTLGDPKKLGIITAALFRLIPNLDPDQAIQAEEILQQIGQTMGLTKAQYIMWTRSMDAEGIDLIMWDRECG